MKIGLVIEQFDPARGGAEHWTWQFARSLARRGHEVHVVAFRFHEAVANDGIFPHRLEMPESRLDRAGAIAAELPAMKFDIVHDMGVGWSADIIEPHAGSTKALWEHNLMRIPKWRQIRFWREKRYRELEEIERRQHANQNAIILAVSRMLAESFESLHHLPAARLRVIYNGVDVERFAPSNREKYREATRRSLGVREDEVLFLGLAHNFLLKNVEATIRAAAKLAATGTPLRVVIAGGKKTERFIKLVQELKVAHLVTFPGLVDPVRYHAAADVFVHPTWYDPCSLVTLEASSCGLPVITSRFNGAAELMTNGKEGFVLDHPADIAGLASRMQDLLEPKQRQQMGEAGRALAMQHTFEDQATQIVDLYREIISTRPHPAE